MVLDPVHWCLKQQTMLHTPSTPLPREVLVLGWAIISQRKEELLYDMWKDGMFTKKTDKQHSLAPRARHYFREG